MIADSLGANYPGQMLASLTDHDQGVIAVSLNVARWRRTDAQKVLLGQ